MIKLQTMASQGRLTILQHEDNWLTILHHINWLKRSIDWLGDLCCTGYCSDVN